MAQPQIRIVHESEAQRQHVRLQIPCRVEIEGQSYRVSDLSSGGMSVEGFSQSKAAGQAMNIILALPFDDFTLDLSLKAEVQHQNLAAQTLGCRFTDLSTSQLSVLNHVIKAFIAGDVLSAGDVLAVASRDNFVKMRQTKPGSAPEDRAVKIKRYIGLACVAVLAACALFFVIGNIVQSAFVLKTSDARIIAEKVTVRMPIAGIFNSPLTPSIKKIGKGELIGTIEATPSVQVLSPCDCLVEAGTFINGVYRPQGEMIVSLLPISNAPTIEAHFSMQEIQKLDIGDRAVISVAGSDVVIDAEVTEIAAQDAVLANGTLMGKATLATKQALPPEMVGRPVTVSIKL